VLECTLGGLRLGTPIVCKRGPNRKYKGIFVRVEDLAVMIRDSDVWSRTSSVNNIDLSGIHQGYSYKKGVDGVFWCTKHVHYTLVWI
jgi:hypothetical protein